MIGTYLEAEGCLGAALVGLSGGDMGFIIVDGFVMALETAFTFVLVNVNGLAGGGGGAEVLREPMDSNRSFPVMSPTPEFDFAALEIFRHMLYFKSRGNSCENRYSHVTATLVNHWNAQP